MVYDPDKDYEECDDVLVQSSSIIDLWQRLKQSEHSHRVSALLNIFNEVDRLFDHGYLVMIKIKIDHSPWMTMEFKDEDYKSWVNLSYLIVHYAIEARQIKIIYCGIAKADL